MGGLVTVTDAMAVGKQRPSRPSPRNRRNANVDMKLEVLEIITRLPGR